MDIRVQLQQKQAIIKDKTELGNHQMSQGPNSVDTLSLAEEEDNVQVGTDSETPTLKDIVGGVDNTTNDDKSKTTKDAKKTDVRMMYCSHKGKLHCYSEKRISDLRS
jgi:hypothetical protein